MTLAFIVCALRDIHAVLKLLCDLVQGTRAAMASWVLASGDCAANKIQQTGLRIAVWFCWSVGECVMQ